MKECTSTHKPHPGDASHINIRYVPEDLESAQCNEFYNSPERVSDNPTLSLEGKDGEHDGEDFEIAADKETSIGRHSS